MRKGSRVSYWTKEEDQLLADNYPDFSRDELRLLLPRRSTPAIRMRASLKGLTHNKSKSWKERIPVKKQNALTILTEEGRVKWLNDQHWEQEKSINQISSELGIARHGLTKYFKKYNVPYRSMSEHLRLRYSKMSDKEKSELTEAARAKMLEMMADEDTKTMHVQRMHSKRITKDTKLEKAIEKLLVKDGVFFEKQKSLGNYLADFFLPELSVIIECDGKYWHSQEDVMLRDMKRDKWLNKQGFTVLRLKERDIKRDPRNALTKSFKENGLNYTGVYL